MRSTSVGGHSSSSSPSKPPPLTAAAAGLTAATATLPTKQTLQRAETTNAGDSDSDDAGDDASVAKVPRELLSPVPRDQLTSIVVFGADGNLAQKKLLPTLYDLWRRRLLPRDVLVFGYARPAGGGGSLKDTEAFRSWLLGLLATDTSSASSDDYDSPKGHLSESHHQFEFVSRCHFAPGQFGDVDSTRLLLDIIECEERKRRIARRATESARRTGLKWLERTKANKAGSLGLTMMTTSTNGNHAAAAAVEEERPHAASRMYYLSVPPFLYAQICSALTKAKSMPEQWVMATAAHRHPRRHRPRHPHVGEVEVVVSCQRSSLS